MQHPIALLVPERLILGVALHVSIEARRTLEELVARWERASEFGGQLGLQMTKASMSKVSTEWSGANPKWSREVAEPAGVLRLGQKSKYIDDGEPAHLGDLLAEIQAEAGPALSE